MNLEGLRRIPVRMITRALALVRFLGGLVFFSGLIVLGYQVYFWLKHEEWIPLPLLIIVLDLVSPQSWLKNPSDWYGLHRLVMGVLQFIPLSAFLIVVGVCIWIVGVVAQEETVIKGSEE